MPRPNKIESIIAERGEFYGSPKEGWKRTGQMWSAIIGQWLKKDIPDIPPHITCLMMAALKINRACNEKYHEDNYLDAEAYLGFSKEFQKAKGDIQKTKVD